MQRLAARSAFALATFITINAYSAEDALVVTATRFQESYAKQPVNMTVITSEQIRNSPSRTLPELLSEQVGIYARDLYGNHAALASVDMRGFGATATQNTLVLLDGRRVNDIDQSGVQWPSIPLWRIERVEILRGAGGVLYGEGATGGVINIITRSPIGSAREVNVEATAGSYGTQGLALSGQGGGEGFGIALSGAELNSEGYRANNRHRQNVVAADARWGLQQGMLSLKLSADRQDLRLPAGRQVRPSTGLDQYSSDRRGARTPQDYSLRDGNQLLLDYDRAQDWGAFNLGLGYRDKQQQSYFDLQGPLFTLTDLKVISLTPRLRFDRSPLDMPMEWVLGADWYLWDYGRRTSNASSSIGQPINRLVATQENLGAYLHGTLHFSERLKANLGMRTERQTLRADDSYDPGAPGAAFGSAAPAADHSDGEIAYEAALRYQVDKVTAVSGRFGRNFRFANADEIYEFSAATFAQAFQFLRPQRARPVELSLEQRWARFDYRVTAFRIELEDEIHLDPFSLGVGNRNLPPSRRQGIELESRWSPASRWMLSGAYAYTQARFREGVLPGNVGLGTNLEIGGKTVPLVPRHKLNLLASWSFRDSTRVNFGVTHVGEQYLDNDEMNTAATRIPAYTVADLRLNHQYAAWNLRFTINNLFNRKYYSYAVRSNFTPDLYEVYPLPERTLTLTAAYQFR